MWDSCSNIGGWRRRQERGARRPTARAVLLGAQAGGRARRGRHDVPGAYFGRRGTVLSSGRSASRALAALHVEPTLASPLDHVDCLKKRSAAIRRRDISDANRVGRYRIEWASSHAAARQPLSAPQVPTSEASRVCLPDARVAAWQTPTGHSLDGVYASPAIRQGRAGALLRLRRIRHRLSGRRSRAHGLERGEARTTHCLPR